MKKTFILTLSLCLFIGISHTANAFCFDPDNIATCDADEFNTTVTVGPTINGRTTVSCDPGPCVISQGFWGGFTVCDQEGTCVGVNGNSVVDETNGDVEDGNDDEDDGGE